MSHSFPFLTSPLNHGNLKLKNRMVMSPMTTSYANTDQTPSQRLVDHFVERAKGGVGLITVELVTVDENHPYMPNSMTLGSDGYIAHHRALVDAIHEHGCKVQPQLSHTGPESVAPLKGGQTVGPSVSTAPVWGWSSRELKAEELPAIAIQYGEAARRAREAGYDGIELHAAHCYNLLGSFISPLRNKRQDGYSAYGADKRIRFIVEVLAEIKARAGQDFPITLSISGYERYPGGRTLDDTQRLAPLLVAAGVDCFRVSGGISDNLVTGMVNSSEFGYAVNAAQAEAIKLVVDVPVMVVGRIHDAQVAENILANGQADLVAMARPLLADPMLPNKIISDRAELIRPCISCENCIDSQAHQANLRCAVNPMSGREGELNFTAKTQRVVVVGAGTAGLEAARLAAEAGHEVILLERQKRLGGSLFFASTVHSDNERFFRWLVAEVKRLNVDIRLGIDGDSHSIAKLNPDHVIVATGAVMQTPDIPGVDAKHVITGAQMRAIAAGQWQDDGASGQWRKKGASYLAGLTQFIQTPNNLRQLSRLWMPIGKRVVIIGADLAALELAEFFADRGRRVHVLESGRKVAPEIGNKRRMEHMDRFDRKKITLNSSVEIVGIEDFSVTIKAGERVHALPADTVLVAGHAIAESRLFDELKGAGLQAQLIGDATGLGLIAGAVHDAAEAVAAI